MSHLVTICTLLLVLAIATAAADILLARWSPPDMAAVPRPRTPLADYPECEGMAAGHITCADNCRTVLLCMGGSIPPVALETCVKPFVCSAEDGKCVNGTSTCNPPATNILCHHTGMFPDPYDCTVYHMCIEEGDLSIRKECEIGWAYDPLTTMCSKKPTGSACTDLPIRCNRSGETEVFPGNPVIYYVCVGNEIGTIVPELFRCDHGGTYIPYNLTCTDSMITCSWIQGESRQHQ